MKLRLVLQLLGLLTADSVLSQDGKWNFSDVTAEVVDRKPPSVGRMFDYALVKAWRPTFECESHVRVASTSNSVKWVFDETTLH